MKTFLSSVPALVASILMVCSPVFAHHGGSMYDPARLINVKGTVTAYEWANPHVMIYADVLDGKGDLQKWSIETRGGPKVLAKSGWTKDTIKIGEQITFVGYPNKNGSPNMRLQKVVFSSAMELYPGSD